MKSSTRQQCEDAVIEYSKHINENLKSGNLLYVGIAGDPPGGEYSSLFPNLSSKTFDVVEIYNPDIVGDITKTDFDNETWDVVICVQTMEHIPNIWDISDEVYRILKPGGYFIIDCPWDYPYHGEIEFGDYWRITKDGMSALFSKNFKLLQLHDNSNNVSCLYKKL